MLIQSWVACTSASSMEDRTLSTPEGLFPGRASEELCQTGVTLDDVLELIDNLQINKSTGPDGIRPRVLKELKCEIADLFDKICNFSLKSAYIPEGWERAGNANTSFQKRFKRES